MKYSDQQVWEKALICINEAIKERDRQDIDKGLCLLYELNRIIFFINLGKWVNDPNINEQIEKDFKWLWDMNDRKAELIKIYPILAPGLCEWMRAHHGDKLIKWFNDHPDKKKERWWANPD
jgi:hypothetical protein